MFLSQRIYFLQVILTLLTRLELGVQFLHLLPQLNVTCSLNFHKTPPLMLALKDPAVAAILKRSENKQGGCMSLTYPLANDMRITAVELSSPLHHLNGKNSEVMILDGILMKPFLYGMLRGEITYEMKDLAYCYRIVEVPTDFSSLSADLTQCLSEVESCKVQKLDAMFNAAYSVNGWQWYRSHAMHAKEDIGLLCWS